MSSPSSRHSFRRASSPSSLLPDPRCPARSVSVFFSLSLSLCQCSAIGIGGATRGRVPTGGNRDDEEGKGRSRQWILSPPLAPGIVCRESAAASYGAYRKRPTDFVNALRKGLDSRLNKSTCFCAFPSRRNLHR